MLPTRGTPLGRTARQQHTQFNIALEQNTLDVQKRLWRDLEIIRGEYEKLIHHELKLVRQKASIAPAAPSAQPLNGPHVNIDWFRFADAFRGSELWPACRKPRSWRCAPCG